MGSPGIRIAVATGISLLTCSPGRFNLSGIPAALSVGSGGGGSLAITNVSVPSAVIGSAYSGQLTVAGNLGTCIFWRESMYPHHQMWHTCSPTGALGGTPQSAPLSGAETVTYGVYDTGSGQTAFATFSIPVSATGALAFVSPVTLSTAYIGSYYAVQILMQGGKPDYLHNTLSAALSQPATILPNGWLYFTPTTAGNLTFTDSVTDTYTNTPITRTFTVPVAASTFRFESADQNSGWINVPPARVGAISRWTPDTYGGTQSGQSFVITGSVPPGMAFNTATGGLSGTPTQPGTYQWSVVGTDSGSNTTPSATFSMIIRQASVASRPSGNTGTGMFTASGIFYDSSGVEFRTRGINRTHFDSESWTGGVNGAITGINMCRAAQDLYGHTVATNTAYYQNEFVNNKIVACPVVFTIEANFTGAITPAKITITGVTGTIDYSGSVTYSYTSSAYYGGGTHTFKITAFVSGTAGGPGVYVTDTSDNVSAEAMTGSNGSSFTGAIAPSVLTVSAITSGTQFPIIPQYMSLFDGGGTTNNLACYTWAQTSGSTGQTGTYQLAGASITRVSEAMVGSIGNTTGYTDPNVVVSATNVMLNQLAGASGYLAAFGNSLIVNVVNEWSGTSNTVWRDTYIAAVAAYRTAGYTGPLLIDASSAGQDYTSIINYGPAILASDPQHNIVFSWHAYGDSVQSNLCHISSIASSGGNTIITLSTDSSVTSHPLTQTYYGLNTVYVGGVTGLAGINGIQSLNSFGGSAGAWTVTLNGTFSGSYTGGGIVARGDHYEIPFAALAALRASSGICTIVGEYGPPAPFVPYQPTNVTYVDVVGAGEAYQIGYMPWSWDDNSYWAPNTFLGGWFGMAMGGYGGGYAVNTPSNLNQNGLECIKNPRTGTRHFGTTAAAFG